MWQAGSWTPAPDMPKHNSAIVNDDVLIHCKRMNDHNPVVSFAGFTDRQWVVFEQAFDHISCIGDGLPIRRINPDRRKIILDGLPISDEFHDAPKVRRTSASGLLPVA